jgi:hypothetical protein
LTSLEAKRRRSPHGTRGRYGVRRENLPSGAVPRGGVQLKPMLASAFGN